MIWVAAWLYLFGLIGLHATARDLNRGPFKEWRPLIFLALWPVAIPVAWMGDLYDRIR